MEDKLKLLIYKNNIKLIEYISEMVDNKISGITVSGLPEEEIDIPRFISEDSDWVYDDAIEAAIKQDKTWVIVVSNDIQLMINEDKNWR